MTIGPVFWASAHLHAIWMCILRQPGQDTVDDLRSRDFRKELEEREHQAARERSKEKRGSVEQAKRPRLDQPPANLDADDPVDDDDDDDDSDERYECYIYKYKIHLQIQNLL